MKASRIVSKILNRNNVKHVFGMPGGDVLPLLEELPKDDIKFVLTRNETNAGFMADAINFTTGDLGVCLTTLGPGMTNLVTGLTQSLLDKSSVLAITGDISPKYSRNNMSHQNIDQINLLKEVVLKSYCPDQRSFLTDMQSLMRDLDNSPKGPIHLNLTNDILNQEFDISEDAFFAPEKFIYPTSYESNFDALKKEITEAKFPLVISGHLNKKDYQNFDYSIFSKLNVPVLTTYKGKGLISEHAEFSMGAVGLAPKIDEVQLGLIGKADLILFVEFDFAELRPHWTDFQLSDNQKRIYLGNERPHPFPYSLNALYLKQNAITLKEILSEVSEKSFSWSKSDLKNHKESVEKIIDTNDESSPNGTFWFKKIQSKLSSDCFISLDVGAHRIMGSHALYQTHPNKLLQSNGHSTMGYGIPAAFAAKITSPEFDSVAFVGDMGMQMTIGELITAKEQNIPITVFYFNDSSLALIEVKQKKQGFQSNGVLFSNPNVFDLAKSIDALGFEMTLDNFDDVMEQIRTSNNLNIVEIKVCSSTYDNLA